MKPMLCHKYNDHKHKIIWPQIVQPKLNGIRLLARSGNLQSRSHGLEELKTWPKNRFLRLRAYLQQVGSRYILDGEIYKHGWSLQRINGAAAINRKSDIENTDALEYHIFDIIDTERPYLSYADRQPLIKQFTSIIVKEVPCIHAADESMMEAAHSLFKSQGYEGTIIKDPTKPYGFEQHCGNKQNRWAYTLKRKDWLDDNCEILGWQFGEGKYTHMVGALQLRHPNGSIFSAGSGLSDLQRSAFVDNPPIGQIARIKFEGFSDDMVPLKPTIEAILDL